MEFALRNKDGDYVKILYDDDDANEYFFKYDGERFSSKSALELWKIANELGYYNISLIMRWWMEAQTKLELFKQPRKVKMAIDQDT